MASQYPQFNRSRLKLKPLSNRVHDLNVGHWLTADQSPVPFEHPDLPKLAECIVEARKRGAAVILMMGAHVPCAGVNAHIIDLIDLIERDLLTHTAGKARSAGR